jgi:hypothetical protein
MRAQNLDVRSRFQEGLDTKLVPIVRRKVQRGRSCDIFLFHFRPQTSEDLHNAMVAQNACHMQRCAPKAVKFFSISTFLDVALDVTHTPDRCSIVQQTYVVTGLRDDRLP